MSRIKKNFSLANLFMVLLLGLTVAVYPSEGHSPDKELELQKLFQLRNEDGWKSAWHSEKHIRCRDQLLTHMDWACQKDIYKLEKRDRAVDPLGLFIGKTRAHSLIKPWSGVVRRKREDKSITDECCGSAGCTWEEYAEYCPSHRRLRVVRSKP